MEIFGKSDIGQRRTSNQDEFAVGKLADGNVWAIVCDGMGGANGGQEASSTAVRTVRAEILAGQESLSDPQALQALLEHAVAEANREIYIRSMQEESLSGMGTTIVAAVSMGTRVGIIHVGDSRAYLVCASGIFQLTKDHSYVQEMVEAGKLTAQQAQSHPKKNMITRALGVGPRVSADYLEISIQPGDAMVLCTDGLSNHLDADEIEHIVRGNVQQSCTVLLDEANRRGGYDNITVVVFS